MIPKGSLRPKAMGHTDGFVPLRECRVCKGTNLTQYLDLGTIPLVNRYVTPAEAGKEDPRFPLQILFCHHCALSQLSIVVDPTVLYRTYFYRSSIAKTFIQHCFECGRHAVNTFNLTERDLVVDIASNDGCALNEFRKFGVRVLGVEPARNLAELARRQGIPTITEFWDEETARTIHKDYGRASMITAMNVFAHVHDLDSFLRGVRLLLRDEGVFMIEVPYLLNFVNKTEFDTSYHEHLSYFLVRPLIEIFRQNGMEIFEIKKSTIHGGTIRVYAKKDSNTTIEVDRDSIKWLVELEHDLGLYEIDTYVRFSKDVEKIKHDLLELLLRLKKQGKAIAAYGASAKGTVLTNFAGIGNQIISYVVDDTPEKQGYLTPGTHISIVPSSYLREKKPDYLLLLAWNFADELIQKTQDYRNAGGQYIIPIPNVRIV